MKKKITKKLILISIITILLICFIKGNIEIINKAEEAVNSYVSPVSTEEKIVKATDLEESEEKKDNYIGILEIKKIDMKGIVKEGSTSEVLENYIGHIENTPKYDGNVCLAAHNRGNDYSYFAKINQLQNGDELSYTTRFGTEIYEVDNIKEIDEQDWNLLQNTKENKLTLITCVKDKKDKRLCVQGTKIN